MKFLIRNALLVTITAFSTFAAAIEKPEYKVVFVDGAVEYRLYQSFIVAETEIIGLESWKDASNEGFRRLFKYITGDNNGEEKIAMTAPVQQSKIQAEDVVFNQAEPLTTKSGWKVGFMLPSSYSIVDAPMPEDERIEIRTVPEKLVAAIRYSGRWTTRNFDKYESRLMAALMEENIEILGESETAFYNPPFVPPFMRRNEILVEVASPPS
jgi:effector-binding domain-containing protein